MRTPSNSNSRVPRDSPMPIWKVLTNAKHEELFQMGSVVGRIYAADKASALSLKRAVMDTIRKSADATPLPPIRMYLPDEGREAGTERYAPGPVAFRAAAEKLCPPEFAAPSRGVGRAAGPSDM